MAMKLLGSTCAAILARWCKPGIPLPPPRMMEDVVGLTTAGSKRKATGQGIRSPDSSQGSQAATAMDSSSQGSSAGMGNLPSMVGEGVHQKALMEAVLLGMRDLCSEVQELKMNTTISWELHRDNEFVKKSIEMKQVYSESCKQARGTGTDLGNVRNYCFMGLFLCHQADKATLPEEKELMENLVGKQLRGEDGKLMVIKAKALTSLVATCQVTRTQKKAFVNLSMRQTEEGNNIMSLMTKAMNREGRVQTDVMHMNPVHADLRNALKRSQAK